MAYIQIILWSIKWWLGKVMRFSHDDKGILYGNISLNLVACASWLSLCFLVCYYIYDLLFWDDAYHVLYL